MLFNMLFDSKMHWYIILFYCCRDKKYVNDIYSITHDNFSAL